MKGNPKWALSLFSNTFSFMNDLCIFLCSSRNIIYRAWKLFIWPSQSSMDGWWLRQKLFDHAFYSVIFHNHKVMQRVGMLITSTFLVNCMAAEGGAELDGHRWNEQKDMMQLTKWWLLIGVAFDDDEHKHILPLKTWCFISE